MEKPNKIDKAAVMQYLDELSQSGAVIPGARTLRARFKSGSFSTYNDIIEAWKSKQEQAREAELSKTSLHSADLEGRLIKAILPIFNDRIKDIIEDVKLSVELPLKSEQKAYAELLAEHEEVSRENERLREELAKATAEREKFGQTIADKVEQMAHQCAEEKQSLINKYEQKLREKDDINQKLDALLTRLLQDDGSVADKAVSPRASSKK